MMRRQPTSLVLAATAVLVAAAGALLYPVTPTASQPTQPDGFEISTRGRASGPGAIVTHTLVISAVGTLGDTITFAAEENIWPVLVAETLLPAKGKATVAVAVAVPVDEQDRTMDSVRLTVTGSRSGAERETVLATLTGGTFGDGHYVGCRLDLDRDGAVTADDVSLVADLVGSETGDDNYVRPFDLDHSGRIDRRDVGVVEARLGSACRGLPNADTTELQQAITVDGLRSHLEALQSIADTNGGHRAVSSPGFAESIDYVEGALAAVGLGSVRHTFSYPVFEVLQRSRTTVVSPDPRELDSDDARLFKYSGSGDATAVVVPVDVTVPAGPSANSSSSGCQTADFDGFEEGSIALIQRGGCSDGRKASNAEAAGASALIVFNEGQLGRRAVYQGSLGAPSTSVPAFTASYAVGEEIVRATRDGGETVMHLFASTLSEYRTSTNLVADLGGDLDDVVLVGAHLDSVEEGPGINDNGSGVTAVLEIARQMAEAGDVPTNTVRFAFWGAEEIGLVGSKAYAASLTPEERRKILMNLNFDMLGSTNWSRFVYAGEETADNGRLEGSAEIEAAFVRHFDELSLPTKQVNIDGRSDHGSITAIGIPAGGLHTGTGTEKSENEARLFGGQAGQPYDACYHQGCDTINNIDWPILEQMADAAADVAMKYAYDGSFAYRDAVEATPARPPGAFLPVAGRGGW